MRASLRVTIILVAFAAASAAQGSAARIRVPVWVENGPAVPRPSDFRVTAGGQPADVVAVQTPAGDLLLILALDMTDDLTQATLAKEALAAGISKLPPRTTIAVVRAQDSLKVLSRPDGPRDAAVEAVRSLNISGKAGLLDTVESLGRTGDAVLAKSAVCAAVLYVTDSDIQNYRENFTNPSVNSSDTRDLSRKFPEALIQERINKLSARLARQQTPLFVVHLVYRTDRMNEAYQSGLQQLAEMTAGSSLFCRSAAEVAPAIRQSIDTIQGHYSLTLALPRAAAGALDLQIVPAGATEARILAYRTRVAMGK